MEWHRHNANAIACCEIFSFTHSHVRNALVCNCVVWVKTSSMCASCGIRKCFFGRLVVVLCWRSGLRIVENSPLFGHFRRCHISFAPERHSTEDANNFISLSSKCIHADSPPFIGKPRFAWQVTRHRHRVSWECSTLMICKYQMDYESWFTRMAGLMLPLRSPLLKFNLMNKIALIMNGLTGKCLWNEQTAGVIATRPPSLSLIPFENADGRVPIAAYSRRTISMNQFSRVMKTVKIAWKTELKKRQMPKSIELMKSTSIIGRAKM